MKKFVYIKDNFFESTKLSSIQSNIFFDRISKKRVSLIQRSCFLGALYNPKWSVKVNARFIINYSSDF